MNGLFIIELEKFIKNTYGEETWKAIAMEVDEEILDAKPEKDYPNHSFINLLEITSRTSGHATSKILEDYGVYLAPLIQKMYKLPLNQPFLEVLEKTEVFIKSRNDNSNGSIGSTTINVIRINSRRLEIIYSSTRDVPELAVGILKGLAKLYNVRVVTEVIKLSDGNYLITLETR